MPCVCIDLPAHSGTGLDVNSLVLARGWNDPTHSDCAEIEPTHSGIGLRTSPLSGDWLIEDCQLCVDLKLTRGF